MGVLKLRGGSISIACKFILASSESAEGSRILVCVKIRVAICGSCPVEETICGLPRKRSSMKGVGSTSLHGDGSEGESCVVVVVPPYDE